MPEAVVPEAVVPEADAPPVPPVVVVPPSAPDPVAPEEPGSGGAGGGESSGGAAGEGEGGAPQEPDSPPDPGPEEPPSESGGGGGSGGSDEGPVAPPTDPTIPGGLGSFKLAIIGSSTASGEGASSYAATWVAQLEADLKATVATSVSLENFALGGYTASDLMPGSGGRGSIDEAIRAQPDLIVVALAGSNDLSPEITTDKFMSQLETLRDTAKAAGIPAFFFSTLPKSFSRGERETLALWARTMAATFSSCWIPGSSTPFAPCFIDVFDTLADSSLGLAAPLDSGDGNHPNDAGHALLYKSADVIIKPYVCAKTQCK